MPAPEAYGCQHPTGIRMPAPEAYGRAGQHAAGRCAHRDCGLPEQRRTSPAGPGPAAAPPPADKRGGRAHWTGQPPWFPSAPSPAGPHRCPGRPRPPSPPAGAPFRAWLSRRHGHRWPACRARQHPSALKRHRRAKDNAVLPYIRHYGNYWWPAGGCAGRHSRSRAHAVPPAPGDLSPPHGKAAFPPRGRQHRASCGTPGEVTHSLWRAVEINYNRATAQPDRLEGVITASAFALTARDARRTPRRDAEDFGSRRRSRLRRTLPHQTRSNSDALIARGDPSPDGPAGPARRCRG